MNYIKRDMEKIVSELTKEYACILITGPRQVGKSTLLKNELKTFEYVTLDDMQNLNLLEQILLFFLRITNYLLLLMKFSMLLNYSNI